MLGSAVRGVVEFIAWVRARLVESSSKRGEQLVEVNSASLTLKTGMDGQRTAESLLFCISSSLQR